MADIAFLLLIFFLVATTMNVDSGIQRVLPPMPDETQPQQAMDVKKRNILLVFVSKFDDIMVGGERMDITQLKDKVKEFVLNPADDPNLPEKEVTKIDLIGNVVPVTTVTSWFRTNSPGPSTKSATWLPPSISEGRNS